MPSSFDSIQVEYFERRLHDLSKTLKQKQEEIQKYEQKIVQLKRKINEQHLKNEYAKLQWKSMVDKFKIVEKFNVKFRIESEQTELRNRIKTVEQDVKQMEQMSDTLSLTNIELLSKKHHLTKDVEDLKQKLEENSDSDLDSQVQLIDKSHVYLMKQIEMTKQQMKCLIEIIDRTNIQLNTNQNVFTKIKNETELLRETKTKLSLKLLSLQISRMKISDTKYEIILNEFTENFSPTNTDSDFIKQSNSDNYKLNLIKTLKEAYENECNNNMKYTEYLNKLESMKNERDKIEFDVEEMGTIEIVHDKLNDNFEEVTDNEMKEKNMNGGQVLNVQEERDQKEALRDFNLKQHQKHIEEDFVLENYVIFDED